MGCYSMFVPEYTWDDEKNERLMRQHGISFEEVVYHLNYSETLADIPHHNQERYPGQRLHIVRINNLAWAVAYRRTGRRVFLYTAYPSEKFTRMYRGHLGGDDEQRQG